MKIEGIAAVVAGGASGLGAATARKLHSQGASVAILDRNAEIGEQLAAELGDRAMFFEVDVTDGDNVGAAIEQAASELGPLRVSVCCAGIGWAERTASKHGPHSLQPFETVIAVNLIGTFNVLRHAAASMIGNDPINDERGVCIHTASVAAFDGQIGQLAYSASKGGIVGMTLPAARDLARSGIRVNTIAPGLFNTPLLAGLPEENRKSLGDSVPFPARLGEPSEYAALAAHIVENQMINGETIRLDGAIRMAPK